MRTLVILSATPPMLLIGEDAGKSVLDRRRGEGSEAEVPISVLRALQVRCGRSSSCRPLLQCSLSAKMLESPFLIGEGVKDQRRKFPFLYSGHCRFDADARHLVGHSSNAPYRRRCWKVYSTRFVRRTVA